MGLTAADIAEILRLVEESTFDELSLEFEGLKLEFKRSGTGDGRTHPGTTDPAAPAPAPPAPGAAQDPELLEVRSPMLGTFYRAPKPGAAPFVAAGSVVEPDSIVGIIEVMKLMNTVRALARGTVTEIAAADGALVEYGEVLMRVRKPD